MIDRHAPRAASAVASERRGYAVALVRDWLSNLPGNPYSRRVALLKVALPAIGVSLLLLVVVWPRLAPLFDHFRFAAIDLREARELRMINPRYVGTDRDGRPVVITGAVGRQVPDRNDVVSLDQPVANLQSHSGAKIVVTSDTGVYQTQTQYVDMFGKVTVSHENGSTFVTTGGRLDAANDAAEGHNPVEGHGPQGDVTGEGFQIIDKGTIVIFTGKSTLLLKSAKQQDAPPAPTDVPAPVAKAAAQIEARTTPAPAPVTSGKKTAPAPHQPTKAAAQSKPAAKKPG
jgi:lipopolysaccharide export system protein LptC